MLIKDLANSLNYLIEIVHLSKNQYNMYNKKIIIQCIHKNNMVFNLKEYQITMETIPINLLFNIIHILLIEIMENYKNKILRIIVQININILILNMY